MCGADGRTGTREGARGQFVEAVVMADHSSDQDALILPFAA